jgi:signal transduction histidine kinase
VSPAAEPESRTPRLARFTVGGWVGLASAAFGLIAVIAIVFGVIAISNLTSARHRVVEEVDPASLAAATLLGTYLDQETGVRGYALTAKESFLEPYTLGLRQVPPAVRALNHAVAPLHDRRLARDVAAVLAAGREWAQLYAGPTIAIVRSGGPISDPGPIAAGKARFDDIRRRVARLQSDLAVKRRDAKESLNGSARNLSATFIVLAVAILLGGALIFLGLRAIVSRPVARLAHRTRRVAVGEFDRPVAAEGPRDINALGHDVESMRARIVQELAVVELARAELERSNAELEQFAYIASHDLQEPLRKVSGFTDLLRRRYRGQLDERADQYIDFAVDGATRMQQLINDLLAFSRVGQAPVGEWAVFGADEALDDALAALSPAIEESDAAVERSPLPHVRGQRSLIAAVFQNLVGNAIKFSRPGEPPHVTITARPDGDHWEFQCADNGIGIDPDYAERIFMIFQRLHPKDAYPGTGIGLALCRKIVEYHGGTIWLEPSDGGGSTLRFTLPVPTEEADVPAR